jgi:hypothetical protein
MLKIKIKIKIKINTFSHNKEGSFSTVHGASSGCGWRKCLRRGG